MLEVETCISMYFSLVVLVKILYIARVPSKKEEKKSV